MEDVGTYTIYKASYALSHASSILSMVIICSMIFTPIAIVLLGEREEPLFSFFGSSKTKYYNSHTEKKEEQYVPLSVFFPTYDVSTFSTSNLEIKKEKNQDENNNIENNEIFEKDEKEDIENSFNDKIYKKNIDTKKTGKPKREHKRNAANSHKTNDVAIIFE